VAGRRQVARAGEDPMAKQLPHAAVDREFLVGRVLPVARRLVELGYFKLEVEGLEHVPASGRVVYALNHAGWFALDAFFVGIAIAQRFGVERAPVFATAEAALAAPVVGRFLRRSGAVPSSWFRRPERLPASVHSCGVFPEGVRGNCKPFWRAYRMVDWNRGFVRVAIARDAPIVPVAVLGGEECLPVAWTVRFLEPLIGSVVGLPVVPFPLPTRWKVVFHEPVHVAGGGRGTLGDAAFCNDVARRIQATVQATLDRESPRYPLGRLAARVAAIGGRHVEPPADEDPLDDAPHDPGPPRGGAAVA
jgi:1-acyl-sn-glycerol-3-phosphate acyltransferase